jgi:hypothetical protein
MTTPTIVRAVLFALTIAALGFVPGVSMADPSSATGRGEFTVAGSLRTFSFRAIQNNEGSVTGDAKFDFLTIGLVLQMDINCLKFVNQNMVRISGPITKSSRSNLVGLTATFEAIDNEKRKDPDELSQLVAAGVDCKSQFSLGTFPLQRGKIEVRP